MCSSICNTYYVPVRQRITCHYHCQCLFLHALSPCLSYLTFLIWPFLSDLSGLFFALVFGLALIRQWLFQKRFKKFKFNRKKIFSALYHKNNDTVHHFRNIQCRYLQWTRRESNPCPKAYSLSFYERSLFILTGEPVPSLRRTGADTLAVSVA